MTVEEEITSAAMAKYQSLSTQTREELSLEFEKMYGHQPHPRIAKDFIAKAIARRFQDTLWIEKTGEIPDAVRQGSIKFWNNEAVFVNKEGMKDERAVEMKRNRVETQRVVQQVENNESGMQASTIVLLQSDKTGLSPNYAAIVDILAPKTQMSFVDLEKKCHRVLGKSVNVSAALVIMNSKKIIRIEMATRVVERVEVDVEEEKLPETSVVLQKLGKNDKREKKVILGEPNFPVGPKTTHQVMGSVNT